jgi:predicted transcriptional regulator of viral defense system
MTKDILLKKLRLDKKEFISSTELKKYCKVLALDYDSSVKNLLRRKYLVRLFRGLFYLKTAEEAEFEFGSRYNYLELVAKAMKLKSVNNWYFGLHTALKLNDATHETFVVEDVISAYVFRAKPINIAGHKFKFYKLSKKLVSFGIVDKSGIRYSDLEKTVIDFAYIWKYRGKSNAEIASDLSDWMSGISKTKLKTYLHHYPKSITSVFSEVMK